ncbi:MAG: 2OG-Fe(II) oxygenase [Bacteroidia bacterium]
MDSFSENSEGDTAHFELAADTLMAQDHCVIDGFVSEDEGRTLLEKLSQLHSEGQFHSATIGRQQEAHRDASIRGDEILWLEKDMDDGPIRLFLSKMEAMIGFFNRHCYTGIRDFESHFAMYPPGSYYHRHLDQFRGTDSRKFTFILYLNFGWQPEDGGQLRIYLSGDEGETVQDIEPLACRLVCFRSANLPHEVLLTHKSRFSITGWWLDRERGLGFLR